MTLPGNFQSCWACVDGRLMHHVASTVPPEAKTPVVLVHGVGLSHRYLMPYAMRLAPFHPVFVPDMPGFGLSFKPRRVLPVEALSEWVIAWMGAIGLDRAIMLGNSAGCQIIVEAAARHPERILRAVLQGPTVDPLAPSFSEQMYRWYLNRNLERSQEKGPIVVRDYWECGPTRLVRTFQHGIDHHVERRLPLVACPAMVVRGGLDPIVPQRWAEEATDLLPRGRLVVLPGVPHTANLEAPLELLRVTRPFFQEEREEPSAPRSESEAA